MLNLTLICVYNNEQVLNSCLLKSVKAQSVEAEIILLDNRNHTYTSAAQACNAGALKATKDYLLFLHQDIVFQSPNDLQSIYQALIKDDDAVLGVAGCSILGKEIYSNIVHGQTQQPAGTKTISEVKEVDALDECLIACSKKTFDTLRFNEDLCDGWDLYGVDFCYRAKMLALPVYVMPIKLWHVSPGNPKHAFYSCARRLRKHYRKQFSHIRTCCITIPVPTRWYGDVLLYLLEVKNMLNFHK